MRSFRHVKAGLAVGLGLTAIFAGQAFGQSRIAYSLELGGDNNAAAWKSGTPQAYVRNTDSGLQTFYQGDLVNWAVVLEASGVHSYPGHASDAKEIAGAANAVFNLELRDNNGQLVADAIFKSTINDGTGTDPLFGIPNPTAAAAFSYSMPLGTNIRRLIDRSPGPRMEPIYTYPYWAPGSGRLIGQGAGYKEWYRTGTSSLFTLPGVGMVTYPSGNPVGSIRRNGYGIVPVAEGQIDMSNAAPGTYHLTVSAGNGNNVLRGDFDMFAATNRPAFAVAVNQVAQPFTKTFVLTDEEPPPVCNGVVGRYLFYNQSYWDGNTAAITVGDFNAIATDKEPLLPGQGAAQFKNVSGYTKGINGIIIDACNFNRLPVWGEDLWFTVGNTQTDPYSWPDGPAPLDIQLFPGQGVDGSDRLVIIWQNLDEVNVPPNDPAGSIPRNKWLLVWLFASPDLGIPEDDYFMFGSAPGETNEGGTYFIVNAVDRSNILNNQTTPGNPSTVTDPNDVNRSRLTNATDASFVNTHQTSPSTALRVFSWN